ncbi:hypothetical protein EZV62_027903 [Acer yangbiense]|uniref:F-box domain-containing protein n=1 Tax=Acer yangbiense TaxID=1000413 RepID=A0A5C7GPU2_9ROSI|nr:hypothetical protein EZV62_027903 [Acer yangbiense]
MQNYTSQVWTGAVFGVTIGAGLWVVAGASGWSFGVEVGAVGWVKSSVIGLLLCGAELWVAGGIWTMHGACGWTRFEAIACGACGEVGGNKGLAEFVAAACGACGEIGGNEGLAKFVVNGVGTATLAPESGSVFFRGISCAAGEWAWETDSVIHHILSRMDAKYAVQTCVLSKKWKFHWAHIHCYSFDCLTSASVVDFEDFVINVLNNRKPFSLSRPKFCLKGATTASLVKIFYRYAMSYRFEEIDVRKKAQISDHTAIDRLSSLPNPRCKLINLGKLKFICGKSIRVKLVRTVFALKTLQISASLPGESDLFSNCMNLENLLLAKCSACYNSTGIFTISAPRLVSLTISDFRFYGKIMITAPRLKFFNMKESSCLLSIDKCLDLDEVNILISPSIYEQMTNWYTLKIRGMVEGLCNAKSISVALNLSKVSSSVDAEAKVVKLNQDSGEEELLFVFPVVSDLCLDQLATIVEDMLAEKIAHMSNHMEIDRLSNLPDPIIHHILSLMNTKYAVQTCVLPKKWRYHWTHICSLNLKFIFKTIGDFGHFVHKVFHRRKRYPLSSIKFHLNDYKSPSLAKIVSDYALSKSLEEFDTNLTVFPPSLYQCQNLRDSKTGSLLLHDLDFS